MQTLIEMQKKARFGKQTPITWRTAKTKIRGCNHYLCTEEFESLEIGNEVLIAHSPTDEFYELTKVFVSGAQIGTIMQEFAISLTNQFGKGYMFSGKIAELGKNQSGEKTFFNILIEFNIPIF